jgi:hypothetical protein
MFNCLACGVTEPYTGRHICAKAGEPRRQRRREVAKQRLNRISGRLDRRQIAETSDFCDQAKAEGRVRLPDPRQSLGSPPGT